MSHTTKKILKLLKILIHGKEKDHLPVPVIMSLLTVCIAQHRQAIACTIEETLFI
jgi:hypothetical protein